MGDLDAKADGNVIRSDLPLYNDRTRSYVEAEVMPRVRKWASSDGSGDVDKIDFAKFKRAFLWHDAAHPDLVGSYRLKIGDVINGKLYAIWRGATVLAGVMQGARGGTTIPETDRAAVKAEIEKYYAKARKLFDDDSIQVPWAKADPAPVNLKNRTEFKDVTLDDVKVDAQGVGTFEGYASTFGNEDLQGDVVMPGAFKKTIADNGGVFRLLDQHDVKVEIGLVRVAEDGHGLRITRGEFYVDENADPSNEVRAAREAYVKMKRRQAAGMPLQFSIGYRPINPKWDNGRRLLREIALAEISTVTFPANPEAVTTGVKDFTQAVQTFRDRVAQDRLEDAAWENINPLIHAIRDCIWSALGVTDTGGGDAPPEALDQLRVDLAQFNQAVLAGVTALLQGPDAQLQGARQRLELEAKAGRVLSAANVEKLQSIIQALQALVASTAKPEPGKTHLGDAAAGAGAEADGEPLLTALAGVKDALKPKPPTLTLTEGLRQAAAAIKAEATKENHG